MYNKKDVDLRKAIFLIAEVSVTRLAVYLISCFFGGHEAVSTYKILYNILPVNYYAILYCTLLILVPYINRALTQLNNASFKRLLAIALFLFSVMPVLTDTAEFLTGVDLGDFSTIGRSGSNYGYSLINFYMMYLIGYGIRRFYEQGIRIDKRIAILLLLVDIAVLDIWGNYSIIKINDINYSYSYCNPLVILEAVSIFMIFKDTNIKRSKVVNSLAKATFSVYITHGYFLGRLHIEQIINKNVGILTLHIVVCAIALYLIGFIVDKVYRFFWSMIVQNLY